MYKTDKNNIRQMECGDQNVFNSRGYNLDFRMQMVEISQFENAKKIKNKKHLDHLTNQNKLLLEERSQEICLAKLIFPEYDPENEHW